MKCGMIDGRTDVWSGVQPYIFEKKNQSLPTRTSHICLLLVINYVAFHERDVETETSLASLVWTRIHIPLLDCQYITVRNKERKNCEIYSIYDRNWSILKN